MNLSVIIVTRNRRDKLREVLLALERGMAPGDQIVVVDDASTDGTEEMVRWMAPNADIVRIEEQEQYRLSTRINQGLERARHDMIWRLDDDCVPLDDALELARKTWTEDTILAGAVLYSDDRGGIANPDHPWRMAFFRQLEAVAPTEVRRWHASGRVFHPIMCFGGNVFFSRKRAESVGGFDADFDGGWGAEDAWFAEKMMWQSGALLKYVPGISVLHQWHPKTGNHRAQELRNHRLWMRKSRELRGRVGSRPRVDTGPERGAPVPFALLSITGPEMMNYGNLVVEQCLLKELPEPAVTLSVFRPPDDAGVAAIREAGCRVAICSGTTVCSDGTPLWEWARALTPIPVVVVGGCLWYPQRHPPPVVPVE